VAIFFTCSCGQSLRAEEDRAGQSVECPACCKMARVPSLRWANDSIGEDSPPPPASSVPACVPVPAVPELKLKLIEETAPQVPASWRGHADNAPSKPSLAWPQDDADEAQRQRERAHSREILATVVKELSEKKKRQATWRMENSALECLAYPVRAFPIVGAIALAWATALSLLFAIWPVHVDMEETLPRLPLIFTIVFPLYCYTVRSYQVTFLAALAGHAGYVVRPDSFGEVLRSGVQSIWCLVAGPVIPIAVAAWFWLFSGEIEAVDVLILWELCLVGAFCWMMLFLALQGANRRLTDANPFMAAKMIRRRGWRVPVAALAMAVVIVGCLRLMFATVAEGAVNGRSWLELVLWWGLLTAGMFFLLRWLGISSCRAGMSQ
jgi:hypothetical protein